jgi:hypothetical protein
MSEKAELVGRAVWCSPRGAGMTQHSVAEYVERLHEAGFNTVIMAVKGGHGFVYWPSRRFPEAVEPGYAAFDMPAALLAECRKRGMQVHGWFVDFYEGPNGPAYRKHPEWAARDPSGKPTSEEMLRGEKFGSVWMCPARRPGYTDQWLVPLMREFAEMYDFDAVHHDYIRYPGDVAPDRYCFCDYCLEQIPRFNGYYYESRPDEPFYHALYDRPYLEAHWEQGPRVLPGNWERLSREMKANFLLHGSFFPGGLRDLDHFFYTYRTHWVTQAVREVAEAVRQVKPGIEISAAVFKNPIHSGRFIGQDWRQFAPWVEYCMPMDYRDHFPGDFDTHLDLLEETVRRQREWARDFRHLWIGIAINFLYGEEERPLRVIGSMLSAGRAAEEVRLQFEKVSAGLQAVAPELHGRLSAWLSGSGEDVSEEFQAFLADVPTSYWPREKLERTLERVRSTGVEGICIFCDDQLLRYGMWDTVREALR